MAAYFRLEHTCVNRKTHGVGYLAAVANYGSNINKCVTTLTVNLPQHREAMKHALAGIDESIVRLNGNLCHKLIISFPVELSEEHREQAMQRFLWRVTEGRSHAAAFFHNDHPHNPHAHVLIVDRDENGKSVSKLSTSWSRRAREGLEPNPTEWLRMEWERAANDVMEEYGYEERLDRRTNLERGLEPAGEHRGFDAPEEVEEPMDKAGRAKMAASLYDELLLLQRTREDMERYQTSIEKTQEQLETASGRAIEALNAKSAAELRLHAAEQALEAHVKANGNLKGFTIYKWHSPKRKAAIEASDRVNNLKSEVERATYDLSLKNQHVEKTQVAKDNLLQLLELSKNAATQIATEYGDGMSLEKAGGILDYTIHENLKDISLEELRVMFYDDMSIDEREYRAILTALGAKAELAELDAQMEEEAVRRMEY